MANSAGASAVARSFSTTAGKASDTSKAATDKMIQNLNTIHPDMVSAEEQAGLFAAFELMRKAANSLFAKAIGNAGSNIQSLVQAA